MADPKKDEKSAEAKAPEAPKKLSAADELQAAEMELRELEAKQKLDLTKARIAAVKAELKQQTQRNLAIEAAHLKREKTAKEKTESGELAVYRLKDKSYRPRVPGSPAEILEPGALIRMAADKLPGASLLAVEATKGGDTPVFVNIKL